MNTLQHALHCDGSTDRPTYVRNVLMLATGKSIIDLQVMHLRPDLTSTWSWATHWIDPFQLIQPWLRSEVPLLICLTTLGFFAALVWNSVHRARHAGWNHYLGLLAAVPGLCALFVPVLMLVPRGRRPSVLDIR